MAGRILVAGATGRTGGAAVRHLLEAGFEVRALLRSPRGAARLRSPGVETVIGDVTRPETLPAAVEGCSGVFSALAAGPGRGRPDAVEHMGNLNLLQAARRAGVGRFVYSSALHADHPLARGVAELREKAHFEAALAGAGNVSWTILRPSMFMETLLMAKSGPVAFVPGRQSRPVAWISADDVGLAAARAFERGVTGRHEIAGPDRCTFDEAYRRLSRASGRRVVVLHPPLSAMRLAGRLSPYVRDLAEMFVFFDATGYETGPDALRDTFGVEAQTIERWARRVSRRGRFG